MGLDLTGGSISLFAFRPAYSEGIVRFPSQDVDFAVITQRGNAL